MKKIYQKYIFLQFISTIVSPKLEFQLNSPENLMGSRNRMEKISNVPIENREITFQEIILFHTSFVT